MEAGRLCCRGAAAWLLALAALLPVPAARADDPFTIVMLPDTQHYVDDPAAFANFAAQTQWIVDNLAAENIVFVAQLGDLVENGAEGAAQNAVEWDRAELAMDTLDGDLVAAPDGEVPYATAPGNHDYDAVDDKPAATQFVARFGPVRFAGRSWYHGAAPGDTSSAQVFASPVGPFLHLALEWMPSDDTLVWAQGVITANPGLPAIVTTHEMLFLGNPAPYSFTTLNLDGSGDNAPESVYRKLVEPYPQVFLVLSGHVPGEGRRTDVTALGQPVHQIMSDYQGDPNGGNGWMRLLELRPDSSEIFSRVFSPTYVLGETTGRFRAALSFRFTLGFDFAAHRSDLADTTFLHLREGQDAGFGSYGAALDTHIGSGEGGAVLPDVAHGSASDLRVDGDGDREQALLRFDGLVGTGLGQVPPGTTVERAILTLTTEGPGAESASGATGHRMLVAWDEQSTWDALGDGVQIGSEAEAAVAFDTSAAIASKGTASFDVTSSVQAWVDGAPNHGWLLQAAGTDRWTFRSAQWPALAERPMLTVAFAGPPQVPALPGAASWGLGAALLAAACGRLGGRGRPLRRASRGPGAA